MNVHHYLKPLFAPDSVAVIGGSERPGSVGEVVVKNMLASGYQGKLYVVNPKHTTTVQGVPCFASPEQIPQRVDLAVVVTPARRVPEVIESCGRAGVRSAVVISAGFSEIGPAGAMLERAMVENARRHRVRLLGPNCLGLIRPQIGLNATFARGGGRDGPIGFVSQSGALCTAILDWARSNGVGFSSVISVGGTADVDFGEILDYLVADLKTDSIFLYIEGIRDARHFMSALRAAARVKPVLLIKVGRHPVGSQAARSHTGSLVGSDDVFEAALRRAGVVRLYNLTQLFAATSALFSHFRPRGDRLAILTNGGGPGVIAADRAADLDIPLAKLGDATIAQLDAALPANWSHSNPIDLIGDADPERYRAAVTACLNDEGVDGVLAVLTPQAMTDPLAAAEAVIAAAAESNKPVVTCWMGEEQVREARERFQQARIPTLRTPEPAVEMFHHISSFFRNQQLLRQTPPPLSGDLQPPSVDSARLVIETALMEGRLLLSEMESKAILAAFHIPIAQTVIARSATEAMVYAEELGLPVAMKIDSPQITHKSDAGGVRLNVSTLSSVRSTFQEIQEHVRARLPGVDINGVAIEPMVRKRHGRELFVGVIRDEVFGPAITFAEGGTRVELHRDRAVALPPLNAYLARDMIDSTRIAQMLGAFRDMPPANREALVQVLLRVSEMVCELPWIREMDINPLIVDEAGAVAVDARIVIDQVSPAAGRYDHMAIHPYPAHLATHWVARDGTEVSIRPIRPEDAELEVEFVRNLSPESKYFRFMSTFRDLPQSVLARMTQIDYDREMALVATVEHEGREREVGVCRYAINPDGRSCEFAVVVADDWQGRGLARRLMTLLIESARSRGLKYMTGEFLAENGRMLKFVASLGFALSKNPDDPAVMHGVLALGR